MHDFLKKVWVPQGELGVESHDRFVYCTAGEEIGQVFSLGLGAKKIGGVMPMKILRNYLAALDLYS